MEGCGIVVEVMEELIVLVHEEVAAKRDWEGRSEL